MTASIAYHTPCRQRSVGVAPGQLSPCAVTNLPTRPAPFNRQTTTGRTRPWISARGFVVAVMTPTNHRTAHPLCAASVLTTPRFMGIHGGVQQPQDLPLVLTPDQ